MKITFFGAARTVTGSKHLIETTDGKRILLDCGLFQGLGDEGHALNRDLGFNASEVDYLVLSHAHIDHAGLIPLLVKQGFNGPIFCTPATEDLCRLMLEDSAYIQESDIRYINKRRRHQGRELLQPLYSVKDAEQSLKLFVKVPYRVAHSITEDIVLRFTDAGHILGSAVVNLEITENGVTRRIAFSGDIGRSHPNLIREPEPFPQCDVLITESTYGDKLHEEPIESVEHLLRIVEETCVKKQGKLIIPAFSVGRTQEIVYALDRLENEGRLPRIPVFVDSPLSTNATDIMRDNSDCFNDQVKEYMKTDADPFGFNKLTYIKEASQSKRLNNLKEPCIIISASGMAEAGRIKHHIANTIGKSENTILIVGHCEPQSLGGRLTEGATEVKIFGETHQVNARVEVLGSFSAHGDYKEMLEFLSCQEASVIERVFLVHGEYETQLKYKLRMQQAGFRNIEIPERGNTFEL